MANSQVHKDKSVFLGVSVDTEFNNKHFTDFCNKSGIKHEFTNFYSPEQDGVCERAN